MKLHLVTKPVVAFDVKNVKHRRDYAQFLLTGSWAHCSVRYEMDDLCGELQAVIQRRLLEYYVRQEFKRVVKKPQQSVDNRSLPVV